MTAGGDYDIDGYDRPWKVTRMKKYQSKDLLGINQSPGLIGVMTSLISMANFQNLREAGLEEKKYQRLFRR